MSVININELYVRIAQCRLASANSQVIRIKNIKGFMARYLDTHLNFSEKLHWNQTTKTNHCTQITMCAFIKVLTANLLKENMPGILVTCSSLTFLALLLRVSFNSISSFLQFLQFQSKYSHTYACTSMCA